MGVAVSYERGIPVRIILGSSGYAPSARLFPSVRRDKDHVSNELFSEAEGRFPYEPERTPVCVFYMTCLVQSHSGCACMGFILRDTAAPRVTNHSSARVP